MLNELAEDEREWLESDGLGGFASGTVGGVRTRRYHGLLLAATTPPTGRVMLVQGFDAWVETGTGRHALSSQRYAPGVIHPDGARRIESFVSEPWPTWIYRLDDGTRVQQEIVVPHGRSAVVITWRLLDSAGRVERCTPLLSVRPLLSGRDYHATHHENGAIRTEVRYQPDGVSWHTYDGVPTIVSHSNARFEHAADWYRNFLYSAEHERGLDDTEDLYSPGWLTWDLSKGPAVWLLSAEDPGLLEPGSTVVETAERVRDEERRRRARFTSPLHRAADAYLVQRGTGKTIVAGYPWFTDWGRDTFIALPGLCLPTGRIAEGRDILLRWSDEVSEGMLPNRFPDAGDAPEFNAVDASLWFAMAVHAFDESPAGRASLSPAERAHLWTKVDQILDGYAKGTRYGIRMDNDGLLASGEPGVQLTWMDAKVGDRVITPRTGKPVEVQALWINALHVAGCRTPRWTPAAARARASFAERFWHNDGYLYDVVDVDHVPGQMDASFRPNQIFAVGGLPLALVDPVRARSVVDAVERRLLTPLGLRSLAPDESGYCVQYQGGPAQRDAAYHQGTVWPWLIGGFVRAWLSVRGWTPDAKVEARRRFVEPLRAHLQVAGLGHVSEIADAEAPHAPRGCPFQAWSLAELIRVEAMLAEP